MQNWAVSRQTYTSAQVYTTEIHNQKATVSHEGEFLRLCVPPANPSSSPGRACWSAFWEDVPSGSPALLTVSSGSRYEEITACSHLGYLLFQGYRKGAATWQIKAPCIFSVRMAIFQVTDFYSAAPRVAQNDDSLKNGPTVCNAPPVPCHSVRENFCFREASRQGCETRWFLGKNTGAWISLRHGTSNKENLSQNIPFGQVLGSGPTEDISSFTFLAVLNPPGNKSTEQSGC